MHAFAANLDSHQVAFLHLLDAISNRSREFLIDDVLLLSFDLALCIEEAVICDGRLDF